MGLFSDAEIAKRPTAPVLKTGGALHPGSSNLPLRAFFFFFSFLYFYLFLACFLSVLACFLSVLACFFICFSLFYKKKPFSFRKTALSPTISDRCLRDLMSGVFFSKCGKACNLRYRRAVFWRCCREGHRVRLCRRQRSRKRDL